MITPDLRSIELLDNERVLWTGKPVSAGGGGPGQASQKAVGLFVAGFATFWMVLASGVFFSRAQSGPGMLFPLFGLPFLLVGLVLVFGGNWTALQRYKNTQYVLTDKRAIVITGGRIRSMKTYDLNRIVGTEKQSQADNSGSVVFDFGEGTSPISYSGARNTNVMSYTPPGFYNVADIDTVHRLVEQTRIECED